MKIVVGDVAFFAAAKSFICSATIIRGANSVKAYASVPEGTLDFMAEVQEKAVAAAQSLLDGMSEQSDQEAPVAIISDSEEDTVSFKTPDNSCNLQILTDDPVVTDEPEYDLASAEAYAIPCGMKQGKTLGEVWRERPDAIEYYASDAFTGLPALKAAAKVIVDHYKKG